MFSTKALPLQSADCVGICRMIVWDTFWSVLWLNSAIVDILCKSRVNCGSIENTNRFTGHVLKVVLTTLLCGYFGSDDLLHKDKICGPRVKYVQGKFILQSDLWWDCTQKVSLRVRDERGVFHSLIRRGGWSAITQRKVFEYVSYPNLSQLTFFSPGTQVRGATCPRTLTNLGVERTELTPLNSPIVRESGEAHLVLTEGTPHNVSSTYRVGTRWYTVSNMIYFL